jgi:hypothetical protein
MKVEKTNYAMKQHRTFAALLALMASSMAVMGQYRVENRVSPELYGNNAANGSIRYSGVQQSVLPSEVRYAAISSGALPSEIKAQANAVGPLPPNGALSYIPGYGPTPPQPAPAPTPLRSSELSMGSIRYESAPHPWTSTPTTMLQSPNLNPGPIGPGRINAEPLSGK